MKEIIFIVLVCMTLCGDAQNEFGVTINETVRVDSYMNMCSRRWDSKLPRNSDVFITDDKFVNDIMEHFNYWDGFFEGHKTTLYIYKEVDSVLIAQNENNTFSFTKVGDEWHMKSFVIKATNITLNHVACGLTSKEVFKLLNKKNKKPVDDGEVWLSNKDGSYRFVLKFVEDKLVSITL